MPGPSHHSNVGDPTEWPQALPEMRDIDKLLRCPICYDYINTAMIVPQCSHTYCSLCIRRYIAYKNQCPTCTEPVSEPHLRNNRLVDELVQHFKSVRSRLLGVVTACDIKGPPDEKAAILDVVNETSRVYNTRKIQPKANSYAIEHSDDEDVSIIEPDTSAISKEPKQPNGAAMMSLGRLPIPEVSTPSTPQHDNTQTTSGQFGGSSSANKGTKSFLSPEPSKTKPELATPKNAPSTSIMSPSPMSKSAVKVPCPVCGVEVPERNINMHLDRCLPSDEKKEALRSANPRRKPMPKLVYNLIKDKELKKKLSDLNLPTNGDRQTLIKRHSEFTLQYNAQCDSLQPKSAQEIVKDILASDKNKQGISAPSLDMGNQRLQIPKGASSISVERAQKDYVRKHKSQFAHLIAETRKRMKKAAASETKSVTDDIPCSSESTQDIFNPELATITEGQTDLKLAGEEFCEISAEINSVNPDKNHHEVKATKPDLINEFFYDDTTDCDTSNESLALGKRTEKNNGKHISDQSSFVTVQDHDVFDDDDKVPSAQTPKVPRNVSHEPAENKKEVTPRHRIILRENDSDMETQDLGSCCSPSLYSDCSSQPGSSCSTFPYTDNVAQSTEINLGSLEVGVGELLSEILTPTISDNKPQLNTGDETPSKETDAEFSGMISENIRLDENLAENMLSPESPVFTVPVASKRKRKRGTVTPPCPPVVLPDEQLYADSASPRQVMPLTESGNVIDTAPPVKKRSRNKKVANETTPEPFTDAEKPKARLTRSRARHDSNQK